MSRSLFAMLIAALMAIFGAGAPGVAQAEEKSESQLLREFTTRQITIDFDYQNECDAETFDDLLHGEVFPEYYEPDPNGHWIVYASYSHDSFAACPREKQELLASTARMGAAKKLMKAKGWLEEGNKVIFYPGARREGAFVRLMWMPGEKEIEWRPSYKKGESDGVPGTLIISTKYVNGVKTGDVEKKFIPDPTAENGKDATWNLGFGVKCNTLNAATAGACGLYAEVYPRLSDSSFVGIADISIGSAWGISNVYNRSYGADIGVGKYYSDTGFTVGAVVGVDQAVRMPEWKYGYSHFGGGVRGMWDFKAPVMLSGTVKYGNGAVLNNNAVLKQGQISAAVALTFQLGRGYDRPAPR